jgi:hypothetical protein
MDFALLVPDDDAIGRGYNGWRCGTIRGNFAPHAWSAIALASMLLARVTSPCTHETHQDEASSLQTIY